MLTNRLVSGGRNTAILSRDGEGRPLSITNTLNLLPELGETLAWSGDGLLSAHTLYRPDFTDNRSYSYANLSRRVTQEQLTLAAGSTWTNSFVYDRGLAGGPGALTTAGPVGASFGLWWSGLQDAFERVNTETNNAIGYLAYGAVNGQSTLSAWLDNRPIQIMDVGTNAMQWRTFLELTQGPHQLKASALHPSGFYTAWATNSFTNNIPYQVAADSYDGNGNITNRVWRNASGTTNRTQSLSWDAKGRLREVMSRNANNYGFNWTAVYDGLNRRLAVTTVLVSNGVPSTVPPQMVNSYFDPEVEFLELGVLLTAAPDVEYLEPGTSPSIQTIWKLYGPDLNGVYGGMNGVGGLEGVSPYLNTFNPVISDARGNVLAEVTNGAASWDLARPSGYGAVPGYRPVAFGNGVDLMQSSAWRGREVDVTGYYHLGLRDFDPDSGQWLSYDPFWNEGDPNGQSFCGGDPIDGFDSNGKCVENTPPSLYFGVAPVRQTSLLTTTYFADGTSVNTGLPGQSPSMYDPNQVEANSYNLVTQPTGQNQFFVSPNALPANYGQTTVTPITTGQVQAQMDDQFIVGTATVLATIATDTEGSAPDLLAAEDIPEVFDNAPAGFSNGNLAQQAHDNFQQALNDLYGTQSADWRMATAPGQTGVDATYVGPASRNPGFSFGELKPYSANSLGTFGNQLGHWGLPGGQTELFFYNNSGVIGSSGFRF
jgi:RHS repeat-associated protein